LLSITATTGLLMPQPQGRAAEEGPLAKGKLLVCNKGDQTLSIVDPVTNKQIAAIAEDGITGHEVAASLDGKFAYVPIFGNSGVGKPGTDGTLIRVIDLQKKAISGTIDFGLGVRPHCPVVCRKKKLLYVTTENQKSVAVIDPVNLKVLGSVPTGQEQSHMLAVSRDGTRGYTANVGPGNVSVLDLEERKLLKVIPVTPITQRIALSVDDKFAFTSDQIAPRLAVIDTQKQEISKWIDMPGTGYGTAPTPDGNYLVVALMPVNKVALIDLKTWKVTQTVDVPKAPQEVLVRPDGKMAYVSCDASKQVAAISLPDFKVAALIDVGPVADGLAWTQEA
jgi:YVTN family beta-propeller protein